MIMAMIRDWLRRWLGIEELKASSLSAIRAVSDYAATLEILIQSQGKEIEALKYMRSQREARAQSRQLSDWEQVQADYAANPANYEEN